MHVFLGDGLETPVARASCFVWHYQVSLLPAIAPLLLALDVGHVDDACQDCCRAIVARDRGQRDASFRKEHLGIYADPPVWCVDAEVSGQGFCVHDYGGLKEGRGREGCDLDALPRRPT